MRIAGTNRLYLDPREEKTLTLMARDRPPQSTAEIGDVDGGGGRSRVWASSRGFSYPSRNFGGADLYNFAWAQAVQNKPLGLDKMMESKDDDDDDEEFEIEDYVPQELEEEEKEEGEIEEGEIDLESNNAASETKEIAKEEENTEPEVKEVANNGIVEKADGGGEVEEEIEDFDKQVGLILEELEAVTEEEAEK